MCPDFSIKKSIRFHKCETIYYTKATHKSSRLLPLLPFGYRRTRCLCADMSFPGRASGKPLATSASEGLGACINSPLLVWGAVTSAEHINQLTVMGRPDLERLVMQKRLPADQNCIIFYMFMYGSTLFCVISLSKS